jgi:hypothetical protein
MGSALFCGRPSCVQSCINKRMKTITIPANASRDQRDVLIARIIRQITRVQRRIARIQADDMRRDDDGKRPTC